MRGDRPRKEVMTSALRMFTPHARGSTLKEPLDFPQLLVYPACAGIDLSGFGLLLLRRSLPRMRGDRPSTKRRALL